MSHIANFCIDLANNLRLLYQSRNSSIIWHSWSAESLGSNDFVSLCTFVLVVPGPDSSKATRSLYKGQACIRNGDSSGLEEYVFIFIRIFLFEGAGTAMSLC